MRLGKKSIVKLIPEKLKIQKVLVSQPRPAIIEKSPFYELSKKYDVEITYKPFIRVVGVSLKEFRAQRVEILSHTAVIFTSRTTVDSFFHICEEARITVPETMKYICQTEAVALYLQKYIVYRKRKISFGDGSFTSLSVTGSGKSASSSAYSSHSPHERLPMFVASSVCIAPPRTAPGIRLSREGFLLALSTGKPRASRKRNR